MVRGVRPPTTLASLRSAVWMVRGVFTVGGVRPPTTLASLRSAVWMSFYGGGGASPNDAGVASLRGVEGKNSVYGGCGGDPHCGREKIILLI